jgi:uncharacterized protein YbjT (DUF2867 family)
MPTILVTGGTGTLGRRVISHLQDTGCKVRSVSRHTCASTEGIEFVTGDLTTGQGIAAAVEGAEIIVHCAGSNKGDEEKTLNLVRAAAQSGTRHLVYISVVGAERIPVVSPIDRAIFSYFASKLAAERVVADSGLPWTILRATQFHDLIFTTAQMMASLPAALTFAGFRFQPIDTDDVAARLVQLTLGDPAGLVPELGGPQIYAMADLLRCYLQARRLRRPLVPLWLPGRAARAYRAGANLTPEHAAGKRTWEEFLADRLHQGDARSAPGC